MTTASIFSDFWNNLEDHHEQAVFLVLVGFIGSFAFIRMSTRIIRSESVSWWPGNIESETGLHLHHLVFGIVTMMLAGTSPSSPTAAPLTPRSAPSFRYRRRPDDRRVRALGPPRGRLLGARGAQLGRRGGDHRRADGPGPVGINPFAVESDSAGEVILSIVGTLLLFLVVLICISKGRILHGVIGLFIPPLSIYGASRLGKPDSFWAQRRYGEHRPRRQARAEVRFPPDRRTERFKEAFRDIVGGKPSEGLAAVGDEAAAATREAGDELRGQAERLSHAADRPRQERKSPRQEKKGD